MTSDEIRALLDGLPGPEWEVHFAHGEINTPSGYPILSIKQETWDRATATVYLDDEDVLILRFIVAARKIVPDLMAERDAALAQVERLRRALEYIMDGYGLNAPDFRQTETDDDGERIQDDWIVACIRAALAERNKP